MVLDVALKTRLRRQVLVSHLSGMLAGAGAAMLGPILPALAAAWSIGDAEAGGLLAAEFAGAFCGAAGCGWLNRRCTLMTTLTAGLALLAIGLAGSGMMVRSLMPLCLFACGVGLGFMNPTASVIVARASLPSPAVALNLFNVSWAAGALTAPFAIAFALLHQSPGIVFLELAALAAAVSWFAGVLRTDDSGPPRSEREVPSARAGLILVTAALLFLYVGIETSISVWLPSGAARWLGVTASGAAAAQSAFLGALLSGRLLAPIWLRRVSPETLILTGLSCGAAGICAILAAQGYATLLMGAILAGLGLAPVNPTVVAAFTTRLGTAAAYWTGPVFAAAALGGASIPWLLGAISSRLTNLRAGFAAPLLCIAVMLGLQAISGRLKAGGRVLADARGANAFPSRDRQGAVLGVRNDQIPVEPPKR